MENLELAALIADMAKEVGNNDPIDFGDLAMDEDAVYNMMAINVLEKYKSNMSNEVVMLSTITHLLVENFILNVKLGRKYE